MKPSKRIHTRSLWEGLEELRGHALKLKLLERMAVSEVALKRFWKRVKVNGEDECWEFNSESRSRYGNYSFVAPKRKRFTGIGAHRVSYFLFHKSLPEEAFICHRCDNKKCVNPKHLFLGDKYLNMIDRDNKNRQAKGESITLHKLTESEVVWARKRYAAGGITYTEIGKTLKVTYNAISRAVNRYSWKHVL